MFFCDKSNLLQLLFPCSFPSVPSCSLFHQLLQRPSLLILSIFPSVYLFSCHLPIEPDRVLHRLAHISGSRRWSWQAGGARIPLSALIHHKAFHHPLDLSPSFFLLDLCLLLDCTAITSSLFLHSVNSNQLLYIAKLAITLLPSNNGG
ncbi:hypothetical protein ASPVEDRAFT_286210 [Aspergillus versicolor CBS 583.65]|uniref:Uncharacterized protein n=1 Tax=Aspergillus versicolor CBS 583.65 TaxID=1036611 RepID=A0A1L9P714_ASPVE|nr:uncharacterized protein ASPVEDRAFT_286210 [Aspergillus versicolor CBS 583.65]OJI97317.1 hypothetical protein ASPVEDRAFT_286210 [Aspergillus versicolor CBS 583.65]